MRFALEEHAGRATHMRFALKESQEELQEGLYVATAAV